MWTHATGGMPNKNGQPVGTRVATSKLTPAKVLAIRSDDRVQRVIANDYGICQMTVSLIKRKVIWSHV